MLTSHKGFYRKGSLGPKYAGETADLQPGSAPLKPIRRSPDCSDLCVDRGPSYARELMLRNSCAGRNPDPQNYPASARYNFLVERPVGATFRPPTPSLEAAGFSAGQGDGTNIVLFARSLLHPVSPSPRLDLSLPIDWSVGIAGQST